MALKKRTSKKSTAAPAPLLKLTFEIPKQGKIVAVPIFFDVSKRVFSATFGFAEYAAPSVAQLEAKIKKAIKNGATPDIVWLPVIEISDDGCLYDPIQPDRLDTQLSFQAERKYISHGKNGLVEVGWKVPTNLRMGKSQKIYWLRQPKAAAGIPRLPFRDTWHLLLPYSDEHWENLRALFESCADLTATARKAMKLGDVNALLSITRDAGDSARSRRSVKTSQPNEAADSGVKAASSKPKASGHAPRRSKRPATGDAGGKAARGGTATERGGSSVASAETCICVPKRKPDLQPINPYCKAHGPDGLGIPRRTDDMLGPLSKGPQSIAVGKLDPKGLAALQEGPLPENLQAVLKKRYPRLINAHVSLENGIEITLRKAGKKRFEFITATVDELRELLEAQRWSAGKARQAKKDMRQVVAAAARHRFKKIHGDPAPFAKKFFQGMPDDHPMKLLQACKPGKEPKRVDERLVLGAGFPAGTTIEIWPDSRFAYHVPESVPSAEWREPLSAFLDLSQMVARIMDKQEKDRQPSLLEQPVATLG